MIKVGRTTEAQQAAIHRLKHARSLTMKLYDLVKE